MKNTNTLFGLVILFLIVAGGTILYIDINNRFQPHAADGYGPNPSTERNQWRFPER